MVCGSTKQYVHHPKKSRKKAHPNPKPLSIERLGQRSAAGPSPPSPMTHQRSAIIPTSLGMEIQSMMLHRHPAPTEARHVKKKLKVALPATDLATPAPLMPVPKD